MKIRYMGAHAKKKESKQERKDINRVFPGKKKPESAGIVHRSIIP